MRGGCGSRSAWRGARGAAPLLEAPVPSGRETSARGEPTPSSPGCLGPSARGAGGFSALGCARSGSHGSLQAPSSSAQTCANCRQRQALRRWSSRPSGHARLAELMVRIQLRPPLARCSSHQGCGSPAGSRLCPPCSSLCLPAGDASVPCPARATCAPACHPAHCREDAVFWDLSPSVRLDWNWLVDREVIRNRHPQTM